MPDDHAVDRVAIGDRLRETLQQHHARAFAAHEAIGRGVERLAFAVRRKHRGLRKTDETAGRDHHRDTAGQGRHRRGRVQMCSHAACTAVSAEEQAVSMATLGPRRFRQ